VEILFVFDVSASTNHANMMLIHDFFKTP